MILAQVLLLILSIVLLYYGAEFALESAEKVGRYLGLSPLVIGLLIVGFGTSLPEFFVSQLSALRGETDIALGNIVGSNVANLFLILGTAGLLETLYILRKEIKVQFFWHMGISVILSVVLFRQSIGWMIGILLGAFFAIYLLYTFWEMRKHRHLANLDDLDDRAKLEIKDLALLFVGFSLLYGGGELLVSSGTQVGQLLGISKYVISALFVAFGTSFPEFVTSILACIRKKNTDLITGNIIGSNIFNAAFVLTSISPYNIPIQKDFTVEVSALLFGSLYLLGSYFLKKNFGKISGVIFLAIYLAVAYSWISA